MSSLEFVHLSGFEAGKDSQTRRIVRSQAMRDFRRRQRAEREAGKSSTDSGLGNSKKTLLKPHTRKQPNSGPAERPAPRSGKTIPHGKSPNRASSYSTQGTSLQASSRQRAPVVILNNSNVDPTLVGRNQPQKRVRQARMAGEYGQPSLSPEQHSPLSTSPSTWYTEMEDPFQSPAQLNRMSAFCKSYIHWLMPGVDSETAECVLSNAWETSQCPMLLAACCLASAAHLDAVQRSRPPGNYALYKARILQEVSERMQSPNSATSDEVIGTLACLLSFELSRGSGEALTHLRGLKSIVKMKGGIDSLTPVHLSSMLETLDLLHAAIFDTEPVFCELSAPVESHHLSDTEAFTRWIPLIVAEQEKIDHHESVYSHTLSRLAEFLQICAQSLDGNLWLHQISGTRLHGGKIRDQLQDIVDYFDIRGLSQSHEADDTNYLARCCYCASAILYNLVLDKTPHRHRNNKKYADGLLEAIRYAGDKPWQDVPYLHLFVLLTGGVASDEPSATSYFQAQIVRLIYQMGPGEFRRVKDFFMKYLEMKRALERPERRSSPPMDLDKLQTTDALYLYADWSGRNRSNSSATSSHSYGSPILSRDHSPMPYASVIQTETHARQILSPYPAIDIDSLTSLEFSGQMGNFPRNP